MQKASSSSAAQKLAQHFQQPQIQHLSHPAIPQHHQDHPSEVRSESFLAPSSNAALSNAPSLQARLEAFHLDSHHSGSQWAQEFQRDATIPIATDNGHMEAAFQKAVQPVWEIPTTLEAVSLHEPQWDAAFEEAVKAVQSQENNPVISEAAKNSAKALVEALEKTGDAKQTSSQFSALMRQWAEIPRGDHEWINEFQGGAIQGEQIQNVGYSESEMESWKQEFNAPLEQALPAQPTTTMQSVHDSTTRVDDWSRHYLEQVAPLRDESTAAYEQIPKLWHQLDAQGYGYEDYAAKRLPPYQFAAINPMAQKCSGDVQEALNLAQSYAASGQLHESVLCLEIAASHIDHAQEGASLPCQPSLLWQQLGCLHADLESDHQAIAALRRSLQYEDNVNDEVMSVLTGCFMNERCWAEAYELMMRYLMQRYPQVADKALKDSVTLLAHPRYRRYGQRFAQCLAHALAAAQVSAMQGHLDASIQVLMSMTLFHAEDLEKACACMEAALSVKPDEKRWWLRLGAMRAQSGQFEAALSAYEHILSMSKGYPRALHNKAVVLLQVGRVDEAIHILLDALKSLQIEGNDTPHVGQGLWELMATAVDVAGHEQLRVNIENGDLRNASVLERLLLNSNK